LKREFVTQHPDSPVTLLKAFRRARDIAFERVMGSDPEYLIMSWAAASVEEQRALMGENYWAYNIADNTKTLEALALFTFQQGLTPYKVNYLDLFDPAAAAFPGA
jgi:4,5-dihydroxyphthalate decarboxylase